MVWDVRAATLVAIPHAANGAAASAGVVVLVDRGEGPDGERVSMLSGADLATFRLKGLRPRAARAGRDGRILARCEEVLVALDPSRARAAEVVYDRRSDERLPSPEFPFTALAGADRDPGISRTPEGKLLDRATGKTIVTPADVDPEAAEIASSQRHVLVTGRDRRVRPVAVILEGERELFRIVAERAVLVEGAPWVAFATQGTLGVRPIEAGDPVPSPARSAARVTSDERVAVPSPAVPRGPKEAPLTEFLARYPAFPEADSLWGEVGRRRREAGRTEDAVDAFLKATSSPKARADRDESLDFELADIYAQRGDWAKVVAELDRQLARLSPMPFDEAVFEAKMRKAEALSKRLGRPAEAVPIYRQLIVSYTRFFPDDPSFMRRDKARLFLGEALEATGGKREALDLYDRIVAESVTGTFTHYAGERAGRLRAEGVEPGGVPHPSGPVKTPLSVKPTR
ncbi:MAG: tetratricopeptide repeat protein [Acidobacteriota bacterium]